MATITLQEAKSKIKIEKSETYPYGIIDNVDEVLEDVFVQLSKEKKSLKDFPIDEILKHIGMSEYNYNEYCSWKPTETALISPL